MADSKSIFGGGMQDTGNPVLDSLVNMACAQLCSGRSVAKDLPGHHKILLELAAKEPGGLKVRAKDGVLTKQG